jgi:AcrR family transcriptional regulator
VPTKAIAKEISNHLKVDDGRVMRTKDSRQKIVQAFLSLLRQGNITPSAEDIAKEAKVGLRTVFRRFNEMELLYREVAIEVQSSFGPEAAKPWVSQIWQEQLLEMLERKASIYESVLPYIVAAKYLRHHSKHLTEFNRRWLDIEHDIIASILPFNEEDEPILFNAIENLSSNDAWVRYRKNQKLSAKETHKTMKFMMNALIDAYQVSKCK